MSIFSSKFCIKINCTKDIIDTLNGVNDIKLVSAYKEHELYFFRLEQKIEEIDSIKNINDYATIHIKDSENYINLYNDNNYTARVDDILLGYQLLNSFGYDIKFIISKKIFEFNYNDIEFYIIHINSTDFVLAFDNKIEEEYVHEVIKYLDNILEIKLNDNVYYDITENEFYKFKNNN